MIGKVNFVLDLVKLKTFVVVAATNSFTRAAAELGYCQSSATTHIQALERELGAPFFDRVAGKIIRTEVGRRTLEYANRLLALADEAKVAVQGELTGPLSAGAPATQLINLLLVDDHAMFRQGLARVLERESGFKVVGQFGSSAEALAALDTSGATMILLDVDLGHERALDFVLGCKKKGFKGQVVVVTAGSSGQEAVQLVPAALGVDFLTNTHPR